MLIKDNNETPDPLLVRQEFLSSSPSNPLILSDQKIFRWLAVKNAGYDDNTLSTWELKLQLGPHQYPKLNAVNIVVKTEVNLDMRTDLIIHINVKK